MKLHQVQAGETWPVLAARYQLSERQLRVRYNQARFMTPLSAGEWIWLPSSEVISSPLPTHAKTLSISYQPTVAATVSKPAPTPTTAKSASYESSLPQLGRPNPKQAPRASQLQLTLASAAKAAADDKLDKFLEQQSSHWADSTLSFGSAQLSDLLWGSPEHWSWDYQLPLFDKELLFNSRFALPLTKQVQGEVGVDYRDQRLTYQAGLNIEHALTPQTYVHLEPVMDYQSSWEHQRGGLLLYVSKPDWTLGAGRYYPLSGWQQQAGQFERAAAGQVVFGEGRLDWLPGLSVSSQFYQWQGKRLNLYGSGDKYKATMSRKWSLNYAPWQILRLQSSVLSNSKDKFETRFRLGVELPISLKPGLWWKNTQQSSDYQSYQPLQHHSVLVLEQR
ncbi:inverse autotransporter beta domain-containing protein [Oceanisphaera avium]|nr:inverse autotransporter beta domain-containing protein [Oceanisphaera avium]